MIHYYFDFYFIRCHFIFVLSFKNKISMEKISLGVCYIIAELIGNPDNVSICYNLLELQSYLLSDCTIKVEPDCFNSLMQASCIVEDKESVISLNNELARLLYTPV